MGGALTLATAVNVRGLAAAVPYYGLPGDLDWSKIDAPLQAHFAQARRLGDRRRRAEDQGSREGPDGAPRLRRAPRVL
jgi:dienelactone hydrolase